MVKVPGWTRRVLAGVTVEEVQRFDSALREMQTEVRRRSGDVDEPWCHAAQTEIENASQSREAYQLESGWSALKSAASELVRSFDQSELVAEASAVRNEADEKLNGWRRVSVAELLPRELFDAADLSATGAVGSSDSVPKSVPDDLQTRLIKAKALVDRGSDNAYHKHRILRRAVIITSVSLAVVLVLLVVAVALEWVPSESVAENSPLADWKLLVVVMCLGAVGAYLSSATQLATRDNGTRIPDLRIGYTLMGLRPIVGATGSVVVIVVFQSALAEAVSLAPTAIAGVAIAAGFTERLATRTVTSAARAVGG